MSIRPLDLQVMIPKLQEVSKMSHIDQQKGQVQQNQIANTLDKDALTKEQTVTYSQEEEKTKNEQDAKDQGKNAYYRDPREKRNQQNSSDQKNNQSDSELKQSNRHKIDIKI